MYAAISVQNAALCRYGQRHHLEHRVSAIVDEQRLFTEAIVRQSAESPARNPTRFYGAKWLIVSSTGELFNFDPCGSVKRMGNVVPSCSHAFRAKT